MKANAVDLEFLGAVLHARRSRIMEEGRLGSLCDLQGWTELVRAIYPGAGVMSCEDFQRRLVQDLAREVSECLNCVAGAAKELLRWMLMRFQLENARVLVRFLVNKLPWEQRSPLMMALPQVLPPLESALEKGATIEDWITELPFGVPRLWLRKVAPLYQPRQRGFLLESVLERGYAQGFLFRLSELPGEEKELAGPVVYQEINIFQLMLILRGKFHYGLASEQLLPLLIQDARLSRARLLAAMKEPDPLLAAGHMVGKALSELPPAGADAGASGPSTLSALEALTWQHFLEIAYRCFRRSHMGLGAVVGYVAIRRLEVVNLIRLSEALRMGLAPEEANSRLIQRRGIRRGYV